MNERKGRYKVYDSFCIKHQGLLGLEVISVDVPPSIVHSQFNEKFSHSDWTKSPRVT